MNAEASSQQLGHNKLPLCDPPLAKENLLVFIVGTVHVGSMNRIQKRWQFLTGNHKYIARRLKNFFTFSRFSSPVDVSVQPSSESTKYFQFSTCTEGEKVKQRRQQLEREKNLSCNMYSWHLRGRLSFDGYPGDENHTERRRFQSGFSKLWPENRNRTLTEIRIWIDEHSQSSGLII